MSEIGNNPVSPGPRSPGRIFHIINAVELAIANLALTVILITICWTVVSRYILESPVSWAEDVLSITFAWFIFIGMAAIHGRRGHIGIDILTVMLPDKWRYRWERVVDLFLTVFCTYAAYLCGLQMIISHTTAVTPVLKIPLSILFLSLTLGFALMAIRSSLYVAGIGPVRDADGQSAGKGE